jgi:ligand-binding sensor domain-containing protein/serine phosphatase RsbU (regulator of sigma subunit)
MKRNRNISIWVVLVVLLTVGQTLNAQNKAIEGEVYNIENGLSQIRVKFILQDGKGFLWIGTQDGLNRFDGYNFTTYRHQPGDTTSISDSDIRCISEDKDGNLWIGTNEGLNKFNRKTGFFKKYFHNPKDPTSVNGNVIYSIYTDKQGFVWIKTLESLDRFDPKTDKFTHHLHYNNIFSFISDNSYFSIFEDHLGKMWIGTKDGLNYYDQNLQLFERFYNQPGKSSLSNDKIKTIFEDHKGNLWVGTENGLNLYNRKTKNFTTFFHDARNPNSLTNNSINTITEDHNGNLWIGTDDGINKFDPKENKFTSYNEVISRNSITEISIVESIIEDHSKILWFGTIQGLIKYDLKGKKFNLIRDSKANNINLSSNNVASIYVDQHKSIWIGTLGAGLNIYNSEKKQVKQFKSNQGRGSISNDYVHVIFKDRENRIIIGTNNGLDSYNQNTSSFVPFFKFNSTIDCNIFKNNQINSIIEDRLGDYWIGTNHGLHKYDRKFNIFRSYYQLQNDSLTLKLNRVYSLLEDTTGCIWIGTEVGLIRYYRDKNLFYLFAQNKQKQNKGVISNNLVYSLFQDSKNRLWVGTASGLNLFNFKTKKFKVYTEKEGLPNNLIYAIAEDEQKNIWVSTNRGLAKLEPDMEKFETFDVSDGLQSYEYNIGASYKSQNGELFFGGINGLNFFHPDSLIKNTVQPKIAITSFEIITKTGRQRFSVEGKDTIVIPSGANMFTIDFSALDFTCSEKNSYSYMMVEDTTNEMWVNAGFRHSATFSNLQPGLYFLKVKGSNNDQIWNNKGVCIKVLIKAPFWNTNIAYLIYALSLLLGGYAFIQFRVRKLKQSNKILKEKEFAAVKIAQQKEELTLKNKNITDSINYAKRIQVAMMPSEKMFKRILPYSFVYHRPKDIVSGDFFWINENKHTNKVFVAAVDCTGHGVPGAFMSIIGFELFRKITHIEGIEDPGKILNELNKGFEDIFKDVENITLRDGMDIAFCVIDKIKNTLEYSGAVNPLYIIRDNKVIEIKGDRFSIGLEEEVGETQEFSTHQIDIKPDDMIYIFSDGYADQFGGPEGKKYKYRRFRHLLLTIHSAPIEKQPEMLEESMHSWRGDLEQVDDILVIGIKPKFI